MRAPGLALALALACCGGAAVAQEGNSPIMVGVARAGQVVVPVSPNLGLLLLGANATRTLTVPGVRLGDVVVVQFSGAPPSVNMGIRGARVTGPNAVEVIFGADIAVGVNLGAFSVQVSYFGP